MKQSPTQVVGRATGPSFAHRGPVLGDILGPTKGPVLGDILGPQ
ncbi:MAG: hypothetical protein AAF849_14270 [Bacteroidota bacterium]